MDKVQLNEDPVILEIREIRDQISKETAGLSDVELVDWYKSEAQKASKFVSPSNAQVQVPPVHVSSDDPVIQEIREIRASIHEETKNMTDEERLLWYSTQAAAINQARDEAQTNTSPEA